MGATDEHDGRRRTERVGFSKISHTPSLACEEREAGVMQHHESAEVVGRQQETEKGRTQNETSSSRLSSTQNKSGSEKCSVLGPGFQRPHKTTHARYAGGSRIVPI